MNLYLRPLVFGHCFSARASWRRRRRRPMSQTSKQTDRQTDMQQQIERPLFLCLSLACRCVVSRRESDNDKLSLPGLLLFLVVPLSLSLQ